MRRTIKVKRAYEAADPKDGCRVLVDRLWPRGMTKEAAHIDVWLKDIAPSTELRKWFNHDAARWREFEERYAQEVEQHPEALAQLMAQLRRGPVTLVYGAKDEAHNNAVALKEFIESHTPTPAAHGARRLH